MTDYTKTTDFAAKDSLPSGDSGKIIKGTEFETEFDNISTAIATKSNIASPTFTGTTTIPTVDINGGAIDAVTLGTNSAVTEAQVDNININGNTISSSDTNGNVNISPNGTGTVVINTDLDVDNINVNGNAITSTNTNGNIDLTPNGTGEVNISKVDINSGAIDGTTVGAASASTGAFTTLTASTSLNIASSTTVDGVLDEDNMASDSASKLATQQSIKAYVDSQIGANNELSEVLSNGNTTGGTDIAVSAGDDITFADNSKAIFGAGSDLQIYHDASDSIINDNGTGSLKLQQGGSTKLEVTATGIDVTGTVTADGLISELSTDTQGRFSGWSVVGANADSGAIELGQTSAYQGVISYSATGSTRFIFDNTYGSAASTFEFRTNTSTTPKTHLKIDGSGDISFYEDTGTTAKFFWDASAESLGIGTTTPAAELEVVGTGDANGAVLIVDDAGSLGVEIQSTSPTILFNEDDTTDQNYQIRLSGGDLNFQTQNDTRNSAATKMTLDSAGSVGIGVVPSAWPVGGNLEFANGAQIGGGNYFRIYSNSYIDSGSVIRYKETAPALRYQMSNGLHIWENAASGTAGNAVTFSEAMRIDSSGHAIIPAGVTLGTAAGTYNAANTLDDYEEGTFTASLRGAIAEPATLVTATGYYTKIGRTVNYNISFENKDTTGYSGSVDVDGLPFANGFGRHTAAAAVYSLATWPETVVGVMDSGTTTINLRGIRSGNIWSAATHAAGTTRYLWLSGTYMTTA